MPARPYQVSNRQLAVNHAGLANMLSYQEMKALKELKNDIELAITRGSAISGTTTVAPQTAGFLNKLVTYFTSSSGTTLTEKVFNDILTLSYSTPAKIREVYGNMQVKRTINGFVGGTTTKYVMANDKRLAAVIDTYESQMGVQAIFLSRYQLQAASVGAQGNSWMAIDPDKFNIAWLIPPKTETLGLDGDRQRKFVHCEFGLLARSEKGGVGATGHVANIVST